MRDRPIILVVVALLLAAAVWLVVRDVGQRRGEREEGAPLVQEEGPEASAASPTRSESRDDDAPPPVPELTEEEYERLMAAARQLTAAPEGFDEGIHCRLAEPVETFQGHFLRTDGSFAMGQFPAYTSGEMVGLVVKLRAAQGYLHVPGYLPAYLTWTTERGSGKVRCFPDPLVLEAGAALVRGYVRNAEGEPEGRVWVDGCGGHGLTRPDGTYELEALPGWCELQAFRLDGLFTARGPREEAEPAAGEVQVVDLEVPDFPTAGLGVAIRQTGEGILVIKAVEGSDAYEQGLRQGDRIVSIDGEPTAEMELVEFVETALGREGTGVVLVVSSGGVERELELTRRTLDE